MRLWRDLSVSKKLYAVIGAMAALIACELATLRFATHTLSAARAFVAGEGMWSKAQKDAALCIQRYARTRDERDYRAFLAMLRVPEGDHLARVELSKPVFDAAVVRRGFLQGEIPAEDIDGMIDLLRRFHDVSYLARAIQAWTDADATLAEFRVAAERLHALIAADHQDPRAFDEALRRVDALNAALTRHEGDFSRALGEGSRWMERAVLTILLLVVLVVEGVGLTLTFRTTRAISRGLTEASDAADALGEGRFSTRIPVRSRDELGRMAGAINRMGALLERSYSDLEARVKERTAALEALAAENDRLYQEAREAVRMREEFLSLASHELKTPLTALALQVELLTRTVERAVPEGAERARVRPQLDAAARQVARLAALSGELVDLTSIRLGQFALRRSPCDLAAIVRDVTTELAREAARAGCEVTVEAPAAAPAEVDPLRVGQVVTNLLSNAFKYGRGKPVRVALEVVGGRARLTVSDGGIGIAPEHHARVFERLERVAGPAAKFPGLGLGLYITRQVVELHGGTIAVESALGAGARFVVELPLRG